MARVVKSLPSLCFEGYKTAPGVAAMKGHPEYRGWAQRVTSWSQVSELQAFVRVLRELVENGFASLVPLNRFVKDEAHSITFASYEKASQIGETEAQANPCAAFVLTLVSLVGWIAITGDRLYSQVAGMPSRGWITISYPYASAALRLGDIFGTRGIVDESFNVLMASKVHDYPEVQLCLNRYRQLAFRVHQHMESAIADLADDLTRSVHPGEETFRAEIMALLWTLGFVPECQSMRASNYVPSRSFVKKIVWTAIERLWCDPLTQYVLLEMKDKPPFNIREHRPLFDKINERYGQYTLDEIWEVAPSEIYAQTLISWFKGTLNHDKVGRYIAVIEEVRQYENIRRDSNDKSDWSVYLRMISLAYLLAREFDWFDGEASAQREDETWYSLWSQATRMRQQHQLNPHRPDLGGTLNFPMFNLAEQGFGPDSKGQRLDAARCEKIVMELERYRAAALAYPLTVSPPLVDPQQHEAFRDLLDREGRLLQWLRGAFFLVNYEFLPDHFRLYAADMSEFAGSDPKQLLNFETGRKEYGEIRDSLSELFNQMRPFAPEYANARINPSAGLTRIIHALQSHVASESL